VTSLWVGINQCCHGFSLKGNTFTKINAPRRFVCYGAAEMNGRGQIAGSRHGRTGANGLLARRGEHAHPGLVYSEE
jgi:hypothetical protein